MRIDLSEVSHQMDLGAEFDECFTNLRRERPDWIDIPYCAAPWGRRLYCRFTHRMDL